MTDLESWIGVRVFIEHVGDYIALNKEIKTATFMMQ
jgi:hypothetical protein